MKTEGFEQDTQYSELDIKLADIAKMDAELDALLEEERRNAPEQARKDAEWAAYLQAKADGTHVSKDDHELLEALERIESGYQADSDVDTAGDAESLLEGDTEAPETASWTPSAVIHNTELVPPGVTTESHALVHKALKAGRRHFGSPAATINDSDFEDTKEIAGKAERLTSQHILDWIDSRQIGNAVLVDSVSIPGLSDKDTDHLLILGNTVLAVDTKAFASGYNYKLKNKEYFGDKTEVLKAPRSRRDINGVCRSASFKRHGAVNMNAILGIWRRYLLEEASVMGAVYINSDDTAVQRNAEWYKVFPLLDRESLWVYLDRLHEHSSKEQREKGGAVIGEQINLALVAQVVVGATKPSKASLRDFKKQLKEDTQEIAYADDPDMLAFEAELNEFGSVDMPVGSAVHNHYHIAGSSWTMSPCESSDCESKSFTYEDARRHLNYLGEREFGIGSDYWHTRNVFVAGIPGKFEGGNKGRGKYRYENAQELKIHLHTGRVGKRRYEQVLGQMDQYNRQVSSEDITRAADYLEKRNNRLRKQYRKQDWLAPADEDERSGLLSTSNLHAEWDEDLNIIVADSAEALTEQGHLLASYQDERNNRDHARKKC